MIDPQQMTAQNVALREQLEAKLGVRSRNLAQALRRAGRRLPRRIRARGAVLVAAEMRAGNPKLARQIDPDDVRAAYEDISAHLRSIDVADRRRGRLLSLAGSISLNLLVVLVGFIVFLWWRNYV